MNQETLYIVPAELLGKMKQLREVEKMDYLRSLTGMDWGIPEENDTPDTLRGLGVVYHLESTTTGKRLCVKTSTLDREHPHLPSVCHLWKGVPMGISTQL